MKHGIIENGKLVIVPSTHAGAKPIEFEEVPEFDQATQYVLQAPPIDQGESIHLGVEVHDLDLSDEPEDPTDD